MPEKRMTTAKFVDALAQESGLTVKQSTAALDAMNKLVARQLGKQGPGEVTIPGLMKLVVVDKPATPAHEGINPFTRKPMMFQAKPAHKVVKARILKALKDAV